MKPAEPGVAAYIARWRPSSVPPQAAAFARTVVGLAAPAGRERAQSLLWAAGALADYAAALGLEAVPEVVLHPSVIERFARCAPGLSPAARRTLRTNQRFIARRVVPQLYPADAPLPRERAKKPYRPAEIGGFLALADAQPTAERRMRAAGLICLGAGAGLIRGDLRDIRATDVACRSGGVRVTVRGARARRPLTWTTTPPERQATSAPRTSRRSPRISPAPAPRQTSPAARIRRSAVGWAPASARNPAISAGL